MQRMIVPAILIALGGEPFGRAAEPSTAPAPHVFNNRLAREKSPYLQQHAHNPVDWYPWGQEAFDTARKQHKPIFLSIGYSTCHWCHVMERESFSDPSVAALINSNFIPIKVDREERPDIDSVYMSFVTATTGSGGWPLTVFLTPDRQPFFGGTYFPPEARDGLPGLKTLLNNVHRTWETQQEDITRSAADITRQLRDLAAPPAEKAAAWSDRLLTRGVERFASSFDAEHGGFSPPPKFPRPTVLQFLLHQSVRDDKPRDREMVLRTLQAIADGGIHDQLGGGFHRYSTDNRWFLPHFEKMLYDQAQLAGVCVDAWRITHDIQWEALARETLDYVLRDMTGPDGQFFSAEDADSASGDRQQDHKSEGAFYLWTSDQIHHVLGNEQAEIFDERFGVDAGGNIPADPRQEFAGRNLLAIARPIDQIAKRVGKSPQVITRCLADARERLLRERGHRPRPARDDQSLTGWSGLMISALARAGSAFDQVRYLQAAERNAELICTHVRDASTGHLFRSYRGGSASVPGMLEDYAFYIQALLDLYQATLNPRWLELATSLQSRQSQLFSDDKTGSFFDRDAEDGSILLRTREIKDNALPSANAVSAINLIRLSRMLDDRAMNDRAGRVLQAFTASAAESPASVPTLLLAYEWSVSRPRQVVIAGDPRAADTHALLGALSSTYLLDVIVLGADGGAGQAWLAERVPSVREMKPLAGKAAAYVCENYACHLPMTDPAAALNRLAAAPTTAPPLKPEDR